MFLISVETNFLIEFVGKQRKVCNFALAILRESRSYRK